MPLWARSPTLRTVSNVRWSVLAAMMLSILCMVRIRERSLKHHPRERQREAVDAVWSLPATVCVDDEQKCTNTIEATGDRVFSAFIDHQVCEKLFCSRTGRRPEVVGIMRDFSEGRPSMPPTHTLPLDERLHGPRSSETCWRCPAELPTD